MHDFQPNIEAMQQFVGLPVSEVERDLILATLKQTEGNRTRAASVLGISVRTIRNKLHDYARDGIDVPPAAHIE